MSGERDEDCPINDAPHRTYHWMPWTILLGVPLMSKLSPWLSMIEALRRMTGAADLRVMRTIPLGSTLPFSALT